MSGHRLNVFLHLIRMGKNVIIDPLQEPALFPPGDGDGVGFVDVPVAEGLGGKRAGGQIEGFRRADDL